MLAASLTKTPMAALARPVAGSRSRSLIVTLPGSVKAVQENLEALLAGDVLLHALDLLSGGSGRSVHETLKANTTQSLSTKV
jgi:gephyrin